MKLFRNRLWLFAFPVFGAFGFLLWPISTENFEIRIDEDAVAEKMEYLKTHQSEPDSVPNILLIMVDDMGMADLSLYGGQPQTPNIDALGASGVVFENAYVTSPVCSPSRASVMTGRYNQRFGFQHQMQQRYLRNLLEYYGFKWFVDAGPWVPRYMDEVPDAEAMSQQGLPPSELTLAEVLKASGYSTSLIGKWHLGHVERRLPCDMGFDHQVGFYSSHSLYNYENTPGIIDQKVDGDFTDVHIWSGQRNGPHAIYRDCEEIRVEQYLTDFFTDEAITYMKQPREEPFFMYLAYNAPHSPFQAPEEYVETFSHIEDPVRRIYQAMIANLDDNLGRLFNEMEALGIRDNTLVFFISDNGGAEYTLSTDNGPYKGGKITDFEGGNKVPFILSWPQMVPSGQRYNPAVSAMDIFATSTSVVDFELPDDRKYDGRSLLPYVTSDTTAIPHEHLYWQRGFSKVLLQRNFKMILNEDAQDTVLFELSTDPFEERDVMAKHPGLARELALKHREWSNELPDPLWPPMIYYYYEDGEKTYYFDQ